MHPIRLLLNPDFEKEIEANNRFIIVPYIDWLIENNECAEALTFLYEYNRWPSVGGWSFRVSNDWISWGEDYLPEIIGKKSIRLIYIFRELNISPYTVNNSIIRLRLAWDKLNNVEKNKLQMVKI
jgi:hypothetical protein